MDGENLVHDEAEIPENEQDLDEGSDVEHDGQRHHENVEKSECLAALGCGVATATAIRDGILKACCISRRVPNKRLSWTVLLYRLCGCQINNVWKSGRDLTVQFY